MIWVLQIRGVIRRSLASILNVSLLGMVVYKSDFDVATLSRGLTGLMGWVISRPL